MSPRRPPAPGSGGSPDPTGGSRTSRARVDGRSPAAKKAAPKKQVVDPQPLKKAAAKKTVASRNAAVVKKAPRRPDVLPAPVGDRSGAAQQKRSAAAQRARTVAAGSPISHTPPKGRARTTTASRSGGLRPSSTRPGSARPRAGTPGRGSRKRGLGAGTGRPVWVLGAVGVMLALLILPYFQNWLVQRSELESVRAEVGQATQDVADLKQQNERWKDDDYVRAQARARLDLVMPGENRYVVADPIPTPQASPAPVESEVPEGNRSWFSSIWMSAEAAGSAGQAQATTEVP